MALLKPLKQQMSQSFRIGRVSNKRTVRQVLGRSPLGFGLAATVMLSACSSIPSAIATLKNDSSPNSAETDDTSFDLLPGFQPDPAIGRGEAGGTIVASQLIGSEANGAKACEGYISETPNHQIHLRDDFSYLNIAVDSHSPAALAIVAENGSSWCSSGKWPSIEQEFWPEGRYDVYVGNLAAPEPGDRYELRITEIDPQLEAEWEDAGNRSFEGEDYLPISVAPGFEPDPTIGRGNVGGEHIDTDITGVTETETGDCNGFIDSEADHYLTLEQPFRYLKVLAESDSPTSLTILGPEGEVWCHTGRNPYIEGVWDAGEYKVFLANLDSAEVGDRYELMVTEID